VTRSSCMHGRHTPQQRTLREQRLLQQPCGLRHAQHHVQVLDRLPRRALDQVVDHCTPRSAPVRHARRQAGRGAGQHDAATKKVGVRRAPADAQQASCVAAAAARRARAAITHRDAGRGAPAVFQQARSPRARVAQRTLSGFAHSLSGAGAQPGSLHGSALLSATQPNRTGAPRARTAEDDGAPRDAVREDGDERVVGAAHVACVRHAALLHHVHERLVLVPRLRRAAPR